MNTMESKRSQRRLAAILFTDIEGYTAMMQSDEQLAIATVKRHQKVLHREVKAHDGEVYQEYGDGSLSIFGSALDAVNCAYAIQKELLHEPKVPLRTGIHIGEIYMEDGKLYGDGVNLASRIESIGQAGTVFFSRHVFEKLRNHKEFMMTPVGTFRFKNVDVPMQVYALTNPDITTPDTRHISGKIETESNRRLLRYIGAAVLAICAVIALGLWLNPKSSGSGFAGWEGKKSIAVLPFENLSGDAGEEFFTVGITEDILTQLSKVGELKVISRESSMKYRESDKPLKTVARELGVMSLLKGSVRRFQNKVRISVQLINPETETYVWAEDYDREIEDILNVQREVAMEVTRELQINLTPVVRGQFKKRGHVNPEAYVNYQRGQDVMKRSSGTMEEVKRAEEYFKAAIREDPDFALAHIGLADAYLEYMFWHRAPADEIIPKARETALRAQEIDPDMGECYAVLGSIELYSFNPEEAEPLLRKAIELSPNYSQAYERLAWVLFFQGKDEEFFEMMNTAHELDPLSTKYKGAASYAYYARGQFEEGIAALKQYLELFPDDNFLLWNLGYLYVGNGDYQKAIDVLRKRTIGTETNWILGAAYARSGQMEKAQEILEYHLERKETGYVPDFIIAYLHLVLEDYDQALDYLEKSMQDGSDTFFLWSVKYDHIWNPLRSNPRFQEIMKHVSQGIK